MRTSSCERKPDSPAGESLSFATNQIRTLLSVPRPSIHGMAMDFSKSRYPLDLVATRDSALLVCLRFKARFTAISASQVRAHIGGVKNLRESVRVWRRLGSNANHDMRGFGPI
jgi:hypothetical protein